jgi:hypothetical protein
MNNFEGSDCNVSMEYVMIPHSLVTVTAASKALIAAFLFVIHHVSMEHAMKLLLPVTVQSVNGVCNAATFSCDCPNNFEGPDCSIPICSPACVNGVCNAVTFTCDCQSNFEGSDCSSVNGVCNAHPFAIPHVSMEHAAKVHSLVTVKTTLKALIAMFLFAVQHASMEYAMQLRSRVTA